MVGAVCSTFFLVHCSSNDEQKPINTASLTIFSPPFTVPAEYATRKYDVRRVDVTGDGFEDAILTAFRDSSRIISGFEMLVIYAYDSTKKSFEPVFQQKYFYGKSFDVRDLNRDGSKEIVVTTDGGGNSATASLGMSVIARVGGKYRETLAFDEGAPEIAMSGQDSATQVTVLLVKKQYIGRNLPESDGVSYVDSVVVFSNDEVRVENTRRQMMYEQLSQAQQRYKQAKTAFSARRSTKTDARLITEVYANAAVQLLTMYRLNMAKEFKAFRAQERQYWRDTLPDEYAQALEEIGRGENGE